MQSSLTSLAVCLHHGHEGCSGVRELIREEKKDLSCAHALRSVELISGALQQEVESKKSFFPQELQGELSGYSRLCLMSLAVQGRMRALYITRLIEECQAKADSMTKACPNWTTSITATSFNLAASKKMFLDNDAMAQVSAGVRAFVMHRTATEDVFKVFGQDCAVARPDVFESLLDQEVHARLTCAVKSGVNIVANNSKNPKRSSLTTELYAIVERQSKAMPKLGDGTRKPIELPASLRAALDKLRDDASAASAAAPAASATAPAGPPRRSIASSAASSSSTAAPASTRRLASSAASSCSASPSSKRSRI